eukprot:g8277.t1
MVRLLAGLPRKVCVTGARALVRKGQQRNKLPSARPEDPNQPKHLIREVLLEALRDSELAVSDLDGLIAVPSLTHPHFMEAHFQATSLGLFDPKISARKPVRVRTIDTGGAGPVSALLEAAQMIEFENCDVVAVVAGDCVVKRWVEKSSRRCSRCSRLGIVCRQLC